MDWPTEAKVFDFYGEPGENQVKCVLPFPMKIAWDLSKSVNSYSCHKLVKEPMEEIWNKVLEEYGLEEIKRLRLDVFGGCLNMRQKRGGTSWSMHSWGIAVDIDPERNGLKTKKPLASLSKPEYDKFWEIVESTGAVSLGRKKDFDWMHFQFARI